MRRLLAPLAFLVLCAAGATAISGSTALTATASADGFVGTWSGTFTGDNTGRFSMAITTDKSKKLGGTIAVTPDGGEGYNATFKTVTAEGATMKLAYDSPTGDMSEVQLEATLDGQSLKGTWKVVAPGSADAVARGTFTGTRP